MRLRSPLATARIGAGYSTQQALADEVGVPLQTVSRWERSVHAPQGEYRVRLAQALKLSLRRLDQIVVGTAQWCGNVNASAVAEAELAIDPCAAIPTGNLAAPGLYRPTCPSDRHDCEQAPLFAAGTVPSTVTAMTVDPVEDLRVELSRLVGATGSTATWGRIARDHTQAMETTPSREFIACLTADLAELCQTIQGTSSDEEQVPLRHVSARLSVLMATALTDAAEMAAARRWWRTARGTADAIGDLRLQVWVCGRWALICQSVEMIPQALHLADEADELGERLGDGMTPAGPCAGLAEAAAARAAAWAARGDAARARTSMKRLTDMVTRLPPVPGNDQEVGAWSPNRLRSIDTHVRALLAAHTAEDPRLYEDLRVELDELEPPALRRRTVAHLKWALALVGNGHLDDGADRAQTAVQSLPDEYRTTPITMLADRVKAALGNHRS